MVWMLSPQGGIFRDRGGEKRPGGVQQHMQKRHAIYAFWTNINGERVSFLEITTNKTLFEKDIFRKFKRWKSM